LAGGVLPRLGGKDGLERRVALFQGARRLIEAEELEVKGVMEKGLNILPAISILYWITFFFQNQKILLNGEGGSNRKLKCDKQ
jgi:hypothetical protein